VRIGHAKLSSTSGDIEIRVSPLSRGACRWIRARRRSRPAVPRFTSPALQHQPREWSEHHRHGLRTDDLAHRNRSKPIGRLERTGRRG
jgi:hypothetical protein